MTIQLHCLSRYDDGGTCNHLVNAHWSAGLQKTKDEIQGYSTSFRLLSVLQWQELHKKRPPRCCDNHSDRKLSFFGNQKHRTSLGKSTEVLPQKYGCFMQRSPMFWNSRPPSVRRRFDILPLPPQKKFFENLLHFLHPAWKTLINSGIFGCRFGCRIKCRV